MTQAAGNKADQIARIAELGIVSESLAVMCETLVARRDITPLDIKNLQYLTQEIIKLYMTVEAS